ncbi:MAG TPA: tripartite tricarboxylate transporter TctB family protein [Burkholderiales bacterium]|jgi:hypothetical protein|nr:tripartite tricarboxylate transporter TctB family protein [Burkholderiales bacterium]
MENRPDGAAADGRTRYFDTALGLLFDVILFVLAVALFISITGVRGLDFGYPATMLAILGASVAWDGSKRLRTLADCYRTMPTRPSIQDNFRVVTGAWRTSGIIAGAVLYPFIITPIGLLPATFAVMIILQLFAGRPKTINLILIALAVTAAIWLAFGYLLELPVNMWPGGGE